MTSRCLILFQITRTSQPDFLARFLSIAYLYPLGNSLSLIANHFLSSMLQTLHINNYERLAHANVFYPNKEKTVSKIKLCVLSIIIFLEIVSDHLLSTRTLITGTTSLHGFRTRMGSFQNCTFFCAGFC